ncbi:50S ribosomal protein L25 [Candidatus Saccharibacteria bacterium]|nr:50S ribosomal protein L25 [Candidatus Saccharibacteria bacterium]MBQ3271510.1 50S ribosomal protein L25 [Candidatus Saccharibacteria bacterium]
MSDNKLSLEKRTLTGKKLAGLRADGFIPSVVYGNGEPVLAQSTYNETEKVLRSAGYHSTIDLDLDGKKSMVIVKDIATDPVSRKIINVEFQAVSANKAVEATTPVVIINFEESDASKLYHFALTQSIEELDVKAKPADLPKELTIDATKLTELDDKLTIADIVLPAGVEFADKELSSEQVVASLYDPAAEAAAREAEAEKESADAADVPAENGAKPEESAEGESEEKAE